MLQLLGRLKKHVVIGFVGGSDLTKQKEQLGEDVIDNFDFGFSENGATAYRLGQLISREVREVTFNVDDHSLYVY
jgi:phosphomannomutase